MEKSLPSTPPNDTLTATKPPLNSFKNPLLILIPIIIILAVIGGYFLYQNKNTFTNTPTLPGGSKTLNDPISLYSKNPDEVIMTVGEEKIYQKSLATELAAQPIQSATQSATIALMIQKIASDSAILQGAKTYGFISINQNVYDNKDLNYKERVKSVTEAKKAVANDVNGIKGEIVAIWFNNNFYYGTKDLEKNKAIAFEKITKLHQDVKDKKITMKQAGDTIKNDSSLKNIDPSYQGNAYYPFNTAIQEKITFDENINERINSLKVGEVSEILTGFDKYPSGKLFESLFLFAQVNEIKTDGKVKSSQNWLEEQINKYEVIYY